MVSIPRAGRRDVAVVEAVVGDSHGSCNRARL